MTRISSSVKGVSFLLLAVLINSLQSVAIKWIGGNYSVLEIVTFRSLVALPLTLLFFRLEGRRGLPTTKQYKLEYVRGIFLFFSYTTYMMGLAALPLADVESIRFSGPFMITMSGLGFVWAAWMYFMTRAYSVAQTSVVAPFEYASLPINIMWGFIVWHELPTTMTVAGALLTLLSGLFILHQDWQERPIVDNLAMDNASLDKNT